MAQFVEYADTQRPGIKLVSAKQVQTFLTDTSHGVTFYVVVHAISPSKILITPRFRCNFSLGTSSATDGFIFPVVFPSQGPTPIPKPGQQPIHPEYPFTSKLTNPDGSFVVVPKSIDQNSVSPLVTLEGTIYFEVPKTKAQRVFAQEVEIY
jgi:hypothetical protein